MSGEVERIRDQLRRAYEGGAWHGPSLRELLEGVDAEAAVRKPIPGAHSIWEVCLHIAAWQEETVARLSGNGREDLPEEEDWPKPAGDASADGWREALARLDAAHRSLEEAVGALDDERLRDPTPGSANDVYALLHGVVQHNLYHAGQIAILKKAPF